MSLTETVGNSNAMYLSIVWGSMVQKVNEGTEGARRREYETSDGKKGVKYEIVHKNLTWIISWLEIKDWDFGEQFVLTIASWDDAAKLTMPTDSKYFGSFARVLPNVVLKDPITINPYDFTGDNGKQLRWISVKQDGKKVMDYYYDGKKNLNGLPEVDKKEAKTKILLQIAKKL